MIFLSVITLLVSLIICCLALFIKQNTLISENELLRMELNALKKKVDGSHYDPNFKDGFESNQQQSFNSRDEGNLSLELIDSGNNKIGIIKIIREVTGLGLKESKDLIDSIPSIVLSDVTSEKAESFKKQIESAGGKALIKTN